MFKHQDNANMNYSSSSKHQRDDSINTERLSRLDLTDNRQTPPRTRRSRAARVHDDTFDEEAEVDASWSAVSDHVLALDIAAARPGANPPTEESPRIGSFSSVLPKREEKILKIKYKDASNQRRVSRIKAALLVHDDDDDDDDKGKLDSRIFDDAEHVQVLRETAKKEEEKRARADRIDRDNRLFLAQKYGGGYRVEKKYPFKPTAQPTSIFTSIMEELSAGEDHTSTESTAQDVPDATGGRADAGDEQSNTAEERSDAEDARSDDGDRFSLGATFDLPLRSLVQGSKWGKREESEELDQIK